MSGLAWALLVTFRGCRNCNCTGWNRHCSCSCHGWAFRNAGHGRYQQEAGRS
jgi:hypothetical protein